MVRKFVMGAIVAAAAMGGFGGTSPASAHCTVNVGGCYGGHCYINAGYCAGSCYINGALAYCGSGGYCTVNAAVCTGMYFNDQMICALLPGCH